MLCFSLPGKPIQLQRNDPDGCFFSQYFLKISRLITIRNDIDINIKKVTTYRGNIATSETNSQTPPARHQMIIHKYMILKSAAMLSK